MPKTHTHLRKCLATWKASLLEKQAFLVAAYDQMCASGSPDKRDQADFMDVVSRVIHLIEDEERKAGSGTEEQVRQAFAKSRADTPDTWPDGRWR